MFPSVYIPFEINGVPLFGLGMLLAIWVVAGMALLAVLVRRQGFNADTQSFLVPLVTIGVVILFLPVLLPLIGETKGVPIRGYGVMMLLGVVSGYLLAVRRARQVGLDPEIIMSLAMWLVLAGFVGGRLFYVVQKWDEFYEPGDPFGTLKATLMFNKGGLVVFGALFAAGAALLEFCRRYKLPALALGDLIAPSLLVGLAFGRIGCLLNGCCYGGLCDKPWAVTFPWGSPAHIRQTQIGLTPLLGMRFRGDVADPPIVQDVLPDSPAAKSGIQPGDRFVAIESKRVDTNLAAEFLLIKASQESSSRKVAVRTTRGRGTLVLPESFPRTLPVHPTQIYSAVDAAVLAFLLWAYYPFRRRDGEVVMLMLALHAVSRFILEMIRTDEKHAFFGLTISQAIAIAMLALAAGLWFYLRQRPVGTHSFAAEPASPH